MPQFAMAQWEGHVLASLPFYLLLLPLLLGLLKTRVMTQATTTLQDLAKVSKHPCTRLNAPAAHLIHCAVEKVKLLAK